MKHHNESVNRPNHVSLLMHAQGNVFQYSIYFKMLLTSFLCLLKKEFISKRPSLTFGGEKNDRLEAMCCIMLMIFDPQFLTCWSSE